MTTTAASSSRKLVTCSTEGWHPETLSGNNDGCSNGDCFPRHCLTLLSLQFFHESAEECCDFIFCPSGPLPRPPPHRPMPSLPPSTPKRPPPPPCRRRHLFDNAAVTPSSSSPPAPPLRRDGAGRTSSKSSSSGSNDVRTPPCTRHWHPGLSRPGLLSVSPRPNRRRHRGGPIRGGS